MINSATTLSLSRRAGVVMIATLMLSYQNDWRTKNENSIYLSDKKATQYGY